GPPGSRTRSFDTCQVLRPRRVNQALAITCLAVLPSAFETESAPGNSDFVARWLACALPYRRFVDVLANDNARLGADADRYSFIVSDFHRLLPAGLPAHFESDMPSHAVGLALVQKRRHVTSSQPRPQLHVGNAAARTRTVSAAPFRPTNTCYWIDPTKRVAAVFMA